jgi:hypothetical protein
MLADIAPGMVVQMRKPHPCGSDRWRVERTGADVGLRCLGCGRRVLLPRGRLERRLRAVLASAEGTGPSRHDHR